VQGEGADPRSGLLDTRVASQALEGPSGAVPGSLTPVSPQAGFSWPRYEDVLGPWTHTIQHFSPFGGCRQKVGREKQEI
jgi:hypothetical protein